MDYIYTHTHTHMDTYIHTQTRFFFLIINVYLALGRWKRVIRKAMHHDRQCGVAGRVRAEQAQERVLTLLFTKCMTQGKLLNLCEHSVFSSVKLATVFFRAVAELAINNSVWNKSRPSNGR